MSRPLDGMKLLLAIPTYGPPDPLCQKDARVAMMVASKYGVEWAGDASPNRHKFSTARNMVAQSLMIMSPDEANGIVWFDSDIRQLPTDLTQLLGSARQFNAEFVSGIYHQRASPYDACCYEWRPKKKAFAALSDYPPNVFAPFGGCGFGYVYTSRKLIEDIAKSKHFDRTKGWFPDERDIKGYGEDLSFCYQAMMADHQLYVNTAVIVGHAGDPDVIYRKEALERRPFNRADDVFSAEDWGIPQ